MAGREMGAWRGAVPRAARVGRRGMWAGGLAAFIDETSTTGATCVGKRRPGQSRVSRFQARGSLPSRPMAKPWGGRWGQNGVEKIQERVVEIALPTRSSLVDDGVRVWIHAMKGIGEIVGEQGAKLRDRSPV